MLHVIFTVDAFIDGTNKTIPKSIIEKIANPGLVRIVEANTTASAAINEKRFSLRCIVSFTASSFLTLIVSILFSVTGLLLHSV